MMRENTSNEFDNHVMNWAIYSRKSKFTGKGESIENQIEMCKNYLKSRFPENFNNMQIEVFEDEGFSGGNTNRPQFQEMIRRIKNNEFNALICYRLDRISRNTRDFIEITEILKEHHVDFISMRDNFDTSTPTGRAMLVMVSVFSQLERETTAERIRDNMRELAKTGRWLGGITPIGYKSVPQERMDIGGKKRSSYRLEIIENEIAQVKMIYSKFMETNSLTQTETFLLQNGIKTRRDKDHERFSIKNILQNPVYMIADDAAWDYFSGFDVEIFAEREAFDGIHGIMAYSKTLQEHGKSNKIKDIKEWVIAVGRHKGVISGRDWVKAQEQLAQNKSKSYRKPRSHTALLSGLLVCGDCGSYMRPKLHSRVNSRGERTYHYMCEKKEASRRHLCSISNINGNVLDVAVCEEIKKLSYSDSVFLERLNRAKQTVLKDANDYRLRIKELEKKIADNEKGIQNSVRALAQSGSVSVSYDYINKEIERLHEEKLYYQNSIDEIKRLTKDNGLSDSEFDVLKDLLLSFSDTIDDLTVEEKREAIRAVVRRAVWDDKNIHIYFFGSDDEHLDLPENFPPLPEEIPPQPEDGQMFPLGEDSK